MSLFIRKVELVDEYDNIILKLYNVPASVGVNKILNKINDNEGKVKVQGIFKKFLYDLDNEFREYFKIWKKNYFIY